MKALITGARGFIGSHLVLGLQEKLKSDVEILSCVRETSESALEKMCEECAFVFHFAGVMRPPDQKTYKENASETDRVLGILERVGNPCPVLLASSTQAVLDNPYGKSKRRAEVLLANHAKKVGSAAFAFRLPGLFGAGGRPFYNSVVATWCHCVSRHEDIFVNGRATLVTLAYIDDVVDEFCRTMIHKPTASDGIFCQLPISYTVCLGYLADLIHQFSVDNSSAKYGGASFEEKLQVTFASYVRAALDDSETTR